MPAVKVPNTVNGPDVPPSDLNVHFDYPLDSVDSVGLGDRRGCDECKELLESEQWLAL
jgi:hypothetical protein